MSEQDGPTIFGVALITNAGTSKPADAPIPIVLHTYMCLAVGSAVVHSFVDAGCERIIVCDDSLAAMESLKIPVLKGSIQIHS